VAASQPEAPAFSVETRREGARAISVRGRLAFADVGRVWLALSEARSSLGAAVAGPLAIDVSGLSHADGGSVALLVSLRTALTQQGDRAEFVGAEGQVAALLRLYGGESAVPPKRRRRARGTLDQLGAATLDFVREAKRTLAFVGQLVRASVGALRAPRTVNWADLPLVMERTGADAVLIVLLINFLVGLVMAYQSSPQLKSLGANHLSANLIGISMTRELGPLMTAIVVSGRSGAALAAELGSMRVNEEIDALRTMGLSALRFIVLPRTLGLALVMPVLTLFADLLGILGGLVIGVYVLDLTAQGYLHQLERSVTAWDVWSGVLKSLFFGATIALIASQQGLSAEGGAEGVGRRTTSAVVITLFALILIDATFTILFRSLGL